MFRNVATDLLNINLLRGIFEGNVDSDSGALLELQKGKLFFLLIKTYINSVHVNNDNWPDHY